MLSSIHHHPYSLHVQSIFPYTSASLSMSTRCLNSSTDFLHKLRLIILSALSSPCTSSSFISQFSVPKIIGIGDSSLNFFQIHFNLTYQTYLASHSELSISPRYKQIPQHISLMPKLPTTSFSALQMQLQQMMMLHLLYTFCIDPYCHLQLLFKSTVLLMHLHLTLTTTN